MKFVFGKIRSTLGASLRYLAQRIKSLRLIVVLAMSVASVLAMVIFSGLIFGKIQDIVAETAITNTLQVVNQTSATLDSYIDNMLRLSRNINARLQRTYISPDELQEYLDTSQSMGNDIVSITMFADNGKLAYYAPSDLAPKAGTSLANQSWYDGQASRGVFSFSTPHVQNLFKGDYHWVLTLYTEINVRGNDYVLAIDMNFSSINEYCSKVNIGRRGYAFLMDEEASIVYHPQQQMIYAGIKEEDLAFLQGKEDGAYLYNNDLVMVVSSLDNVGWKTVGISYLQDTRETTNDIIRYMIIAYIAVLILILLMAAAIARYISRPIGRIIQTMEGAQETGFTAIAGEDNYSEVRRLSSSYNLMSTRIRELMDQIKREQRELRKTEIRALQAQINPHFLYNTLDSILWMCEKGDSEGAVVMVSSLGSLFRISLSKGREIITVREELLHAENYLRIQEVRYKDQFSYHFDVPVELLARRTPKILLQPFLENAIYHAFGHAGADGGEIHVRVREQDGVLEMEVEDNGVGMPEELVEKINSGEDTGSRGIGISNVNSRIQIYFGREYGVKIRSEPDRGTTVTIRLPDNITEDDILE